MTALAQAWRALLRRRAFALTAVVTLGASAGMTTAVFTVVHAVLWRPLAYPDAGRLVTVYESSPGARQRIGLIAPARLEDWRRLNRAFTAISGSYAESVTETSGAEPERLEGRRVAPGFFGVYAMPPLAGRWFTADEERFGGPPAAVIGEALWTRRFGRSPSAVGGRLIAGQRAYTIVGVMPGTFAATTDVWLPAQFAPGLSSAREARFLVGIGRLRPGATVEDGRADLARVQQALAVQYPATDAGWSAELRDLRDARVGDYRRPLVLVLAAVGLLFAIAATNVAGLVLVQLRRRAAEFALRSALGASPVQVVAAVLREMLVLGAAASACAVALAWALTRTAAASFGAMPRAAEARLDPLSLLFVLGSMTVAALAFGVLPALAVARPGSTVALAPAAHRVAGGRHRLQHGIVVAQIALGVVLAGCAGLLMRSYAAMAGVDSGADPRGVLTFHVGAAWDEDRVRVGQLQVRLLDELQRLPGVHAAGFANFLPATGATLRYQLRVDGMASGEPNGAFTVGSRTVTPGYLRALAVPLVAGGWCEATRADVMTDRVREAMVNRAFVHRYAAGRELVGRGFSMVAQGEARFRIVGVVDDVLEDGLSSPPAPYVYACLPAGAWPDPEYVVRADGDPRALAPTIRGIVHSLDASRPVFGVKPLADVFAAALDQPKLNAAVVMGFAIAAVALAALGLSGLMLLLVGERRREIGVRLALGASAGDIARLVLGGAARLVTAGLAAGAALTLAVTPLLRAVLFGVAPSDPSTLAAGVLALASAALVAAVLPIRHALSVSATDAMRMG
jgi:putative ABC transport system permease protein